MRGKKGWFFALVLLMGLTPVAFAAPAQQGEGSSSAQPSEYVVVYAEGVAPAAVRQALAAIGGTVVRENAAVGVATIKTNNPNFMMDALQQPALLGAVRNRPIGNTGPRELFKPDEVEQLPDVVDATGVSQPERAQVQAGAEPLTDLQWDMAMIDAAVDGSYAVQPGTKEVLVGIIDSGIDASHPDLAPNFSYELSRNFVTDIPEIDGPCEHPTCVDPVDVDDSGHGTHVAGTVAAALNGFGMAGVAPNVTLVNIRGGQDGGYLFLQPVIDAIVYAGDIGVDVVNMSFYIDPWLYNCTNNPADSPEAQMEQTAVIVATQRAVGYARARGVTLIASAGNGHTDLGNPSADSSSPNYPPGINYPRTVDNSCLIMPIEAEGVIPVSALGPSKAKADYSNYGVEQVRVSAPGGYARDFFGTPQFQAPSNRVLSTYPQSVLEARGLLNPDGTPRSPFVVRSCQDDVCAYYAYLQGTSMAAPHATGVAALIVSQYGRADARNGGLTLRPIVTQKILERTATNHACPEPRMVDYTIVGRPASFNAYCEGSPDFNGFYGEGIVNALTAVTNPLGNR
ncbi:MAG: S8 family serine peptidase [Chloroflexales bacterium]|nr:S8 family serine peptidase [Chloroflexales bacterium]